MNPLGPLTIGRLSRILGVDLREEAQRRLFTKLVQALRPGWILLTGRTERLWPAEAFSVEALSSHFYRRRPLTG